MDRCSYERLRQTKKRKLLAQAKELEAKGLSIPAIAKRLGYTPQYISLALLEQGISARRANRYPDPTHRDIDLCNTMRHAGKTVAEMGKRLNRSRAWVQHKIIPLIPTKGVPARHVWPD